jgi:hypothetical protein
MSIDLCREWEGKGVTCFETSRLLKLTRCIAFKFTRVRLFKGVNLGTAPVITYKVSMSIEARGMSSSKEESRGSESLEGARKGMRIGGGDIALLIAIWL